MSSPSSTKDLQAEHWPSLQPCMSWMPCSVAARRIVWSSSTSISMPTGSNRTTCFSPIDRLSRYGPDLRRWERRGHGGGGADDGVAGPSPSPDPRSGARGGCRTAGGALLVVVSDEGGALGVAHL